MEQQVRIKTIDDILREELGDNYFSMDIEELNMIKNAMEALEQKLLAVKPTVKKYEHLFISFEHNDYLREINRYGGMGWQVAAVFIENGYERYYKTVLKRELQ